MKETSKSSLKGGTMPSENTKLERLLSTEECAEITGRSVGSLLRDRILGRGCPFVKLGHLVRYRPSDVKRYIEQNVRGARQD
jgi:predicted DNA-binding transcriptional regulator AlpA